MPSPNPPTNPLTPLYATLLLTTPLLALLPPRKLDLYTFSLLGAFAYSGSQLYTTRHNPHPHTQHPTAGATGVMGALGRAETQGEEGVRDAIGDAKEELEGVKGLVNRLWMGDEKPGWQQRRVERERVELERGRGYGDIIMEQVWEVFPGFGRGRGEGEEGGSEGEGEGK